MNKLTVRDVPIKGRRVLMRADFNVPLKGTQITDATRILESLPTIRYILEQGGRLVLMSHLGRPDGERLPEASLAPVAARLSQELGRPGPADRRPVRPRRARRKSNALKPGEVVTARERPVLPGRDQERSRSSPRLSRGSATSSSTTRSARRTGPTRRSAGSPRKLPGGRGIPDA